MEGRRGREGARRGREGGLEVCGLVRVVVFGLTPSPSGGVACLPPSSGSGPFFDMGTVTTIENCFSSVCPLFFVPRHEGVTSTAARGQTVWARLWCSTPQGLVAGL